MIVDAQATSKTTIKEVWDNADENDNGMCNDGAGKSGLDSSATMADNEKRANKSICDIPYCVTLSLMKSLDTDKGWEAVAAKAGFTFSRMQELLIAGNKIDGSPTKSLLWQLGCQNYKVTDLYDKLKSAKRLREMRILEEYVEGGEECKSGSIKKKVAESSLFIPIPQLSSKVIASDKKPQGAAESGFSMPGSEVNYNYLSSLKKTKAEVADCKNYDDKVMPGTQSPSLGSSVSFNSQKGRPLQETDLNTNRSGPASHPQYLQGAENFPESNIRFSHASVYSFPSKQAEQPSTEKPEMISNPVNYPASLLRNNDNIASFNYRELFNATDGFSDNRLIGEGAFGKVYFGTLRQGECAIKRLHSLTPENRKRSDQVKSELSALSIYRHENIVTLYGYAKTETELCLVYQYLVGGSLEDRLFQKNNTPPLSWERRLNILVGACKGLNYLQKLREIPLIHGDIKSANILLDQYFEAKLGDLGQAQYASGQSTETSGLTHITKAQTTSKVFGTKAYMAPEITSGGSMSTKSDVYALGIVILEVCSAKQAYDQSRNEVAFLANYFNQNVCGNEESLWKELFQDRTLVDVPDNIFIDVLKLASKCVKQYKKQRPDSVKLLSEMKDIYKRNKERIIEEENSDSLSTSMQNDSRYTIPSWYPSTDNESHHGMKDTCPSQQMYDSKPIQLQQQILEQFHSEKATKLAQYSLPPLKHSSTHHQVEMYLPANGEDTFEIRSNPNSASPIHSFPQNAKIPEAFRLQAAYDSQPERKKIDRLSGLLPKEDQLEEMYPSDPNKLQKLMGAFEMEHHKSIPHLNALPQPSYQSQDNFPQADPKKLAQLNSFDEENFGTGIKEDPQENLECDPVKMAYLNNFDDGVYRNSRKDNCPNMENIITSETSSTISEQDNLAHMQTRQLVSQVEVELSYNPASSGYNRSDCRLLSTNPVINESETVGLFEDKEPQTTAEKDCEFKYLDNHNVDHRSGDDSDIIPNEQAGNSSVVTTGDDTAKPGKKKLLHLFDRYAALKDQADEDSCDSGHEEEEETNN